MEKITDIIDIVDALKNGKMLVIKDKQTITIEPPRYGKIVIHFQQGECVLYEKQERNG